MALMPSQDVIDFLNAIGMKWPQADEDVLREAEAAYRKTAGDFRQAGEYFIEVAQRINGEFSGASADQFGNWVEYLSSGDHPILAAAAAQCEQLATNAGDTATDVEHTKWSIIGQAIAMIAIQAAMAALSFFFGPGVMLGLSFEYAMVQEFIMNAIAALLRSIAAQAVIGAGVGGAVDLVIQGIQIGQGHRDAIDTDLLSQATVAGAIGGAVAAPFDLIGVGIGKWIGNRIGTGVKGALGKEFGHLFEGATVTPVGRLGKAERQAFAKDFAGLVGNTQNELANGFGKGLFSKGPLGRGTEGGKGSIAHAFTEKTGDLFAKHLGGTPVSAGGRAMTADEARAFGKEWAQAYIGEVRGGAAKGVGKGVEPGAATGLGAGAGKELPLSAEEVAAKHLGAEGKALFGEGVPQAIRDVLGTHLEGDLRYRLAGLAAGTMTDGANNALSDAVVNYTYNGTFETTGGAFLGGMVTGAAGRGLGEYVMPPITQHAIHPAMAAVGGGLKAVHDQVVNPAVTAVGGGLKAAKESLFGSPVVNDETAPLLSDTGSIATTSTSDSVTLTGAEDGKEFFGKDSGGDKDDSGAGFPGAGTGGSADSDTFSTVSHTDTVFTTHSSDDGFTGPDGDTPATHLTGAAGAPPSEQHVGAPGRSAAPSANTPQSGAPHPQRTASQADAGHDPVRTGATPRPGQDAAAVPSPKKVATTGSSTQGKPPTTGDHTPPTAATTPQPPTAHATESGTSAPTAGNNVTPAQGTAQHTPSTRVPHPVTTDSGTPLPATGHPTATGPGTEVLPDPATDLVDRMIRIRAARHTAGVTDAPGGEPHGSGTLWEAVFGADGPLAGHFGGDTSPTGLPHDDSGPLRPLTDGERQEWVQEQLLAAQRPLPAPEEVLRRHLDDFLTTLHSDLLTEFTASEEAARHFTPAPTWAEHSDAAKRAGDWRAEQRRMAGAYEGELSQAQRAEARAEFFTSVFDQWAGDRFGSARSGGGAVPTDAHRLIPHQRQGRGGASQAEAEQHSAVLRRLHDQVRELAARHLTLDRHDPLSSPENLRAHLDRAWVIEHGVEHLSTWSEAAFGNWRDGLTPESRALLDETETGAATSHPDDAHLLHLPQTRGETLLTEAQHAFEQQARALLEQLLGTGPLRTGPQQLIATLDALSEGAFRAEVLTEHLGAQAEPVGAALDTALTTLHHTLDETLRDAVHRRGAEEYVERTLRSVTRSAGPVARETESDAPSPLSDGGRERLRRRWWDAYDRDRQELYGPPGSRKRPTEGDPEQDSWYARRRAREVELHREVELQIAKETAAKDAVTAVEQAADTWQQALEVVPEEIKAKFGGAFALHGQQPASMEARRTAARTLGAALHQRLDAWAQDKNRDPAEIGHLLEEYTRPETVRRRIALATARAEAARAARAEAEQLAADEAEYLAPDARDRFVTEHVDRVTAQFDALFTPDTVFGTARQTPSRLLTDPTAAGPDGPDGPDGTNGTNGTTGTESGAADTASEGPGAKYGTAGTEHGAPEAERDARSFHEAFAAWTDGHGSLSGELKTRLLFEVSATDGLGAWADGFGGAAAGRAVPQDELRHIGSRTREDWFTTFRKTWGPDDLDAARWLAHERAHKDRFGVATASAQETGAALTHAGPHPDPDEIFGLLTEQNRTDDGTRTTEPGARDTEPRSEEEQEALRELHGQVARPGEVLDRARRTGMSAQELVEQIMSRRRAPDDPAHAQLLSLADALLKWPPVIVEGGVGTPETRARREATRLARQEVLDALLDEGAEAARQRAYELSERERERALALLPKERQDELATARGGETEQEQQERRRAATWIDSEGRRLTRVPGGMSQRPSGGGGSQGPGPGEAGPSSSRSAPVPRVTEGFLHRLRHGDAARGVPARTLPNADDRDSGGFAYQPRKKGDPATRQWVPWEDANGVVKVRVRQLPPPAAAAEPSGSESAPVGEHAPDRGELIEFFPVRWSSEELESALERGHAHALETGEVTPHHGGYLWRGIGNGVRIDGFVRDGEHVWARPSRHALQPTGRWDARNAAANSAPTRVWLSPHRDVPGAIRYVLSPDGDLGMELSVTVPRPPAESGIDDAQYRSAVQKLREHLHEVHHTVTGTELPLTFTVDEALPGTGTDTSLHAFFRQENGVDLDDVAYHLFRMEPSAVQIDENLRFLRRKAPVPTREDQWHTLRQGLRDRAVQRWKAAGIAALGRDKEFSALADASHETAGHAGAPGTDGPQEPGTPGGGSGPGNGGPGTGGSPAPGAAPHRPASAAGHANETLRSSATAATPAPPAQSATAATFPGPEVPFPLSQELEPRPTPDEWAQGDLTRSHDARRQLRTHLATWEQSRQPETARTLSPRLPGEGHVSYWKRKQQLDAFLDAHSALIDGWDGPHRDTAVARFLAEQVTPWTVKGTGPSGKKATPPPVPALRELRRSGAGPEQLLDHLQRTADPELARTLLGIAYSQDSLLEFRTEQAVKRARQFLRLVGPPTGEDAGRALPVDALLTATLLEDAEVRIDDNFERLPVEEVFSSLSDVFGGKEAVRTALEALDARRVFDAYFRGAAGPQDVFQHLVSVESRLSGRDDDNIPTALPDTLADRLRDLFHELHQFFQAYASVPYADGELTPDAAVHTAGPEFASTWYANGNRSLARTHDVVGLFRYEGVHQERYEELARLFATRDQIRQGYQALKGEQILEQRWRQGWLLADDPLTRLTRDDVLDAYDYRRLYLRMGDPQRGTADRLGQGTAAPGAGVALTAVAQLAVKALPHDFRELLAERDLDAVATASVAAAGMRLLPTRTGPVKRLMSVRQMPFHVGEELNLEFDTAVPAQDPAPGQHGPGQSAHSPSGNMEVTFEGFDTVDTSALFREGVTGPVLFRPGTRGVIVSSERAPDLDRTVTPEGGGQVVFYPGIRFKAVPLVAALPPLQVHAPSVTFWRWMTSLGPIVAQRFELRRFELGDGSRLSRLAIRARLTRHEGVTPQEAERKKDQSAVALMLYHNVGHRFPNGDLVHFTVEFVGEKAVAHHQVHLYPGSGRENNTTWFANTRTDVIAHEWGHDFGAADWYRDTRIRPTDEDGSLMSSTFVDKWDRVPSSELPSAIHRTTPNLRWSSYDLAMLWASCVRAELAQARRTGEEHPSSGWSDSLTGFLTRGVVPTEALLLSPEEVNAAVGDTPGSGPSAPGGGTVPLEVRHKVLWGDPDANRPGRLAPRNHSTFRARPRRVAGSMRPNHTYLATFRSRPSGAKDHVAHHSAAGDLLSPSAKPEEQPEESDVTVLMFPDTMTEDEVVHTARQAYLDWRRRGGTPDTTTDETEFDGIYHGLRIRGVVDATGTLLDFVPHEDQTDPGTGRPLQAPLFRDELPASLPHDMPRITPTLEKFVLYGDRGKGVGGHHFFHDTIPMAKGIWYEEPSAGNQNGTVFTVVRFLKATIRPATEKADATPWHPAADADRSGRHLLFPRDWDADTLWNAVQDAHTRALDSGRFLWQMGQLDRPHAGYLWTGESNGVRIQGYTLEGRHVWVRPAPHQPRLTWESRGSEENVCAERQPLTLPLQDGTTLDFSVSHVALHDGDLALLFEAALPVPESLPGSYSRSVAELVQQAQATVDRTYNQERRGDGYPLIRFKIVMAGRPGDLQDETFWKLRGLLEEQHQPEQNAERLLGFALTRPSIGALLAAALQQTPMPDPAQPGGWRSDDDREAVVEALFNRSVESLTTDPQVALLLDAYPADKEAPHATRHDTVTYLLAQRRHKFSTHAWDKTEADLKDLPAGLTADDARLLAFRVARRGRAWNTTPEYHTDEVPGHDDLSIKVQVDTAGIVRDFWIEKDGAEPSSPAAAASHGDGADADIEMSDRGTGQGGADIFEVLSGGPSTPDAGSEPSPVGGDSGPGATDPVDQETTDMDLDSPEPPDGDVTPHRTKRRRYEDGP
ncbi:hypothetical protein [Streptomyces sp. NPDC059080]|uniref:WXG100-like domain-containing protein n=1 Tax=Streptomyces sp. NPDC059080 TaxID=3346718 RepID=UPI00369F983B